MKTATFLYAVALLLLPFSSALKEMLELVSNIWINPTLILGLLIFLLMGAPLRDKHALWLACFGLLSGLAGSFYLAPSIYREHSSFYAFYAEPGRLCLNIIWYWVSIEFLVRKRDFVLRWLSISVTLQLSIAAYLYLAFFELVPVPDVIGTYLTIYKGRQALWFGDIPIYRMAGTFFEGPPFGLFMFGGFVIFVLSLTFSRSPLSPDLKRWLALGTVVSFVGAVASLSDSVLLAIVVFAVACYLSARARILTTHRVGTAAEAMLGVVLVFGIATYTAQRLVAKWEEAVSPAPVNSDVVYLSGAERMFHVRYGLGRLGEAPLAVLTGIGPGRYGDYAVRTGMFPATVCIAVTPAEWLIEYGVFGLGLILSWLWKINKRSRRTYGVIAIGALVSLLAANASQANWLWETWFLALAFLYSTGTCNLSVQAQQGTTVGAHLCA